MITAAYEELKLENTVCALGKFQGLHKGHKLLLDETVRIAKEKGYKSVLCSIDVKASGYIYTKEERSALIEELGIDVLANCEFNESFSAMSPEDFFVRILIEHLGARALVVGVDFCFGHNRAGNVDILRQLGIKYNVQLVVFDKLTISGNVIGTSYIKGLIEDGCVSGVKTYLGREYSVSGKVVHGKSLGRQIGFPTINVIPDAKKLVPRHGVYESRVVLSDGQCYMGITNVGINPTVDKGSSVKVETNILDFDGDLYDKYVTIFFVRFIRPEMKFSSVDALVKQMSRDKDSILHQ